MSDSYPLTSPPSSAVQPWAVSILASSSSWMDPHMPRSCIVLVPHCLEWRCGSAKHSACPCCVDARTCIWEAFVSLGGRLGSTEVLASSQESTTGTWAQSRSLALYISPTLCDQPLSDHQGTSHFHRSHNEAWIQTFVELCQIPMLVLVDT